jgi:nucleotidyltransferase substrate binding protein (TIGR01987 family)
VRKKHLDSFGESARKLLGELKRALDHLDAQPEAPDRWSRLDAVAKRFEVSFEYVWKFLKAACEYQGTETPGPRPAITVSAAYGWIDDKEAWAGFLEARNAGVHDYFGLSSEEYAHIAADYYAAAVRTVDLVFASLF